MLMNKPAMATDQSLCATFMFSYDVRVSSPQSQVDFSFFWEKLKMFLASWLLELTANSTTGENIWAINGQLAEKFKEFLQHWDNSQVTKQTIVVASASLLNIGHPSTQLIIFHRQSQAFYLHLPQTLPPAELLIHLTLWYLWYKDQLF